jgi:acyl transferase domain-containing protein
MSHTPDHKDRRAVLEQALQAVEEMQSKLDAAERERREPIAIIGMSCRFPGNANSPEAYWKLMNEGVDAIREVPPDRWDVNAYYDPDPDAPGKMYTRMGGFLDDVDKFDAYFFGISPRETLKTDPQQRLVLEVSWEALENAAIAPGKLLGSQTGVFIGITNNDYARIIERAGLEFVDAYYLTGNCLNFAAGRVAYVFGLQGPTMAIDSACSTSGVTVHLACQSLRNRECNLALAGGVNLILSPELSITSTKARTLSPDGYCKTFDASANGYVRGEGCGIVVLKRLSDALADGDNIHAIIRGSAVNQDGASSGITVPNKLAQAEVMRQALERAGIEPNQVGYIEAHGTGTSLGDPIEVRALASVYGRGRSPNRPLIIGTVKTNVGHLESAAGVAGLIKVVLSLQHGIIPPHLHFKKLNPAITLDDIPALIPTQAMPWPREDRPWVAGLSFFGGSGTIAHMIVEEAPGLHPVPENNSRTSHLFCLSAKTPAALDELAGRHEGYLATHAAASLPDVCYTADSGRSHFNHRLAIVSATSEELRARLLDFKAGQESAGLSWGEVQGTQAPKVAFLFTGQGGQYVNMGRRLYESEPTFRRVVDRCEEYLRPYLPKPLRRVLYPQPGETTPLDETQYTHVAMFAIQYGLAELWRSWGVEPAMVMGHSVGEIVAATVAGQMGFEDGLRLMRERGRLMQSLPAAGMMASLLADERRVAAALVPYRDRVAIAAVNGPESTVISGERAAVQAILKQLEGEAVKIKMLKVSNAFHSPLVEPVLPEFERTARDLQYTTPRFPLFSSMRLEWVSRQRLLDATYWSQNLRNTVRFSEAVRALYEQGYRVFLEIGPSPILVSMGSQCVPVGEGVWLPSLREDRDDWQQMLESLGQLYVNGVDVDWDGFYRDRRRRKVVLPTYPFQRERYWVESPSLADRAMAATVPSEGKETHPLLGRRLRSAVPLFEQQLNTSRLSYLNDHRVFDKPVLPATAYLELALAAAAEIFEGKQTTVKNLVFSQALLIPENEEKTIQVLMTETGPGSASFKLFSLRPKGRREAPTWILHASGDVLAEEEAAPSDMQGLINPAAIQERCKEKMEVEQYYELLRTRGLQFGPGFKGIEALWRRDGETIGLISVPAPLSTETEGYSIHPAFMDACLQPVVAALSVQADSTRETLTYLPHRLESFKVYHRPGDRVWSHITLRKDAGVDRAEVTADIVIFDPAGQKVAELRGLVLRQAGREAVAPFEQEDFADWLYELNWEEMPRQKEMPETSSAFIPSPQRISQALLAYSGRNRSEPGLQEFASLLPRLEALSTQYVLRALRELGWRIQEHHTFTTESKARELRVPERYHRLLGRMFEMLQQDGYLLREGPQWSVSRVPPDENPEEELTALLKEYPSCSAELILTGRCGQHFARAMRGESEPLELLFPNGSIRDVEKLYKDSPYFRFYNGLIQEAVLAAIGNIPSNRPIRILEIGAGTGSTTSYLLPKLPPQQTEYVFTDISNLFASKAQETFAGYPFVQYRSLDIEKDPLEQGFSAHSFDLVIAANVLHATADLRQTLQQVRTLLSSEGLLVLLEGTRPLRFADMIVGLTEGWWKFADTDLRPSCALISDHQWRELLIESGFTEVAVSPEGEGKSVLANQSLILARSPRTSGDVSESGKPAVVSARRGDWLILADHDGVGAGLEALLKSRDENCIAVSAGSRFENRGQGHFRIDRDRPEDFQKLFTQTGGSDGSTFHGVVYLWPLDDPPGPINGWKSLKAEIQRGCGSLLHLVKALVSGGSPRTNNLWIVTRGAQSVGSEVPSVSLSQSPTAALGSTIGLEYPELHCTRVDLDPVASPDELGTLLEEIRNGKDENLVAFRHEHRLVARLVRRRTESAETRKSAKADISRPYQLKISSPGILDNLSLCPMERRPPGQGEVEIEVRATGLGFRDVLMALGRYPETSSVFGYECAGRIVNLGEGVRQFQVGQRVLAVAPGSLAAYLTVSTDLVVPVPESLREDEAATIPSAFLTAQYALCHLGKMSAGERALIHAATGGVGLAAVQLAQRAGVEIFATAGSLEKRAYLASLGVPHIMDSRSLDFAEEIMKITAGHGVDLVLNSLAGEFIPKSLSVTATHGRFLEIGRTGIWDEVRVSQLNRNISYFPINLAATFEKNPKLVRSLFEEVMPDFAKGLLKPLPSRIFPIDHVIHAFRYMAQARHIGKVVVSHPSLSEDREGPALVELHRQRELDPNASYLITGGLGGLGLLVARWMSERGARHLVLTGRSGASPSALAVIHEMEEKGTRVVVAQGDVSDRAHLDDVFSRFGHTLPPLRGVVHSAGALDDGVLAQQTWERFERVMAPKVEGAWHLHSLTQDQPLDFFVLFSSAVSLLGSPGQGNHVAACAFEDALAHHRHVLGLPALSINWGPWAEIGAATHGTVSQRLQMKGFHPIEPQQGLRVFEHLLWQDHAQVGVMSVDWRQYVDSLPPGCQSALLSQLEYKTEVTPQGAQRKAPQQHGLLQQLGQAPPNKRRSILQAHIREQAIKVLGLNPSFKLDPNQGLATFGMDSLMTIELKNRLQASVGKPLPSTIVFDHPTVDALAEYLEQKVLVLTEDSRGAGGEAKSAGQPVKAWTELEQMSDEEAEAILTKELSGSH